MSKWNNKTIPFWQETLIFPNSFSVLIKDGVDYRGDWPESFKPSMTNLISELNKSKSSYIKINAKNNRLNISILSGKIIVSCTLFTENNKLFLDKNNGLEFATNYKKTFFIKQGIRIEHGGIIILSGKVYNEKFTDNDSSRLAKDIKNLLTKIETINKKTSKAKEQQVNDDNEFNESESSKIEEMLETLEAYVNKEYEIEDAKARAEKPFVYTEFKAEDIASTYKYYYRITLLKEDIKRLRELNPSILQIKKADETFMDLEIFNIKPENSPYDIIVTTAFQTDRNMIDSSNELYLVAIPTLQKVRQKVIDDLRGKVSPNKWLIPLAAGVYKFKKTIKKSVPEYNKERPLLPAQKDGVDKGAGSEDITLVLGPPGTGKTTVILSWVKYFVSQGKKVLVTSQSNMAVDNVLIRLDEEKEFECLRVGNESKVMREAHGLLLENYAIQTQSKFIASLSEVINSLQSSKKYLNSLNISLKEILQYNSKDAKFNSEINGYKKNISDLNNQLKNTTSLITHLKNDNEFLKELINSLTNNDDIGIIENKLSSKKEVLLYEQFNKSLLNLNNLKKDFSKIKQKIDNHSSKSKLTKMLMHFPNQMNISEFNKLVDKIANLEKDINVISKKLLIENNNKIDSLNESLNNGNKKLNILKANFGNSNQKYTSFTKSKPKIPMFTECLYIDDKIYKNINPTNDICNKLISQIAIDLNIYNSLIEIVSIFERSMNSERQSSLYETILEYVDVVGATCIGINSNKLFANIPFDVVIVDESGQIQLHNLMVPLSRASKAILVGDHKQLPPVVDEELEFELKEENLDPIFLQKSWFEILWNQMPNDHKTMLDTQFRCPAIISDFVSKAFYESKYFAGSGMEKKKPILSYYNSTMSFIDTSNIMPSFEQSKITDGRTEVLGNEVETTIIIEILMNFIKELPYLAEKNEIGIIVPYKNHVLEVKRTIKKLKLNIGNLNVEDLIASVDSYQGQERDVIIFAFSRSNKSGNIGFLADWRRLNVAMTRTKKQLIMVGSLKTLTMDNKKEHESEFKQAMKVLESELRAKNSIIDGRKILKGVEK